MTAAPRIEPVIGDWFRSHESTFEVVAVDERDGTIEIQHHDGSLEELELDEWSMRCKAGTLERAEQPEDYSGALDSEPEDEPPCADTAFGTEGAMRASGLEGLDLFE